MNYRKKKKNNMILLLLVLLGSLGIGYALLTQELTINGLSKVKANTWDIHFENLVPNQNNVALSTGDVAAVIDTNTETDITYTVTLQKPGDFYEFTVDVVNEGTIDGMVGTVTSKLNDVVIDSEHPLPAYLNYSVTYSDGREILPNHLLAVGATETYKVRLEYKLDISQNDLPSTAQTNTLSFSVNYVQADSTAVTRPTAINGTRYTVNKYDSSVSGYNAVWLNQAVPNGITLYQTQQEALAAIKTASTKDFPFYLKHTIANDIVTESYVEILIDNTTKQNIINLACNSDSTCETKVNAIPNGTYTLRGGDSGASYTANKAVIESMFGTGCSTESHPGTDTASLSCIAGSFYVGAGVIGSVAAGVSSDRCDVYSGGNSYCYWSQSSLASRRFHL